MRSRLVALLITVVLASFAPSATTSAADIFPPTTTGYDLSWPQCSVPWPAMPYAFGIIGATGGKAFTHNPCLANQHVWAAASGHPPSLYMNLKSPVGTNAEEALSGPKGACLPTDQACLAYNFGYKTAQDAVAYANAQRVSAASWWLDVETASSWSSDTAMNAIVIAAAIDFLKAQGATVGIYSSQSQWVEIAGSYSPGLPVWVATAPDASTAPSYCARAFGGGQVQLVQYISGIYDVNYACSEADRVAGNALAAASAPVGPPGSTAMIATDDGDCLNVRPQAGFSGNPLACLASGTLVTLQDGSVVADGYRWQLVSSGSVTGWVANTYLRSVPAGTEAGVPPVEAAPPLGTFAATPVFGPSGQALAVFNGGSVDQLEAAALASGASGVWAQEAHGSYQLLIVYGPAFVNAAFRSAFPDGFASATALSLRR